MESEKRLIKRVKRLSDCTLVRLLLRRLWQWQDAAGVSMGRSLRSALLEAVFDFVKLPEIKNIDEIKGYILLAEAEKRVKKAKKIHLEKSQKLLPLEDTNNRSLAHLLLLNLHRWYKQDEEEAPKRGESSLTIEKKIVDACIPLLLPTQNCFHLYYLKWEDILEESRNRRFKKAMEEFRRP